jgi:hypothetical protein
MRKLVRLAVAVAAVVTPLALAPAANAECIRLLLVPYC